MFEPLTSMPRGVSPQLKQGLGQAPAADHHMHITATSVSSAAERAGPSMAGPQTLLPGP